MNIQELTHHPELLNRETLYELRRLTAEYPYYQPARLLMLKNLYLLHDPAFDEELRRGAIYFTDRKVLFNLVEAAHYRLKRKSPQSFKTAPDRRQAVDAANEGESRTVSLIDTFLSTIPEEGDENAKADAKVEKQHRKPTAADATVDYVAYLLSTDFEELTETEGKDEMPQETSSSMNGGALIDAFIQNEGGKITLQEEPEYLPEVPIENNNEHEPEEEFLTETLAGIYIKQGRYQKALDIMNKINATNQRKNIYFEDQKRFLKKLIANQK
ncbi:MAG: tetratricopeptide repeat protein [Prevotella sp.]|nr:tetratricopeptide repeat protein [Candidatus Prevotella equi]